MNTAELKARAKQLLSKNYGYCLAVSLIMTLTGLAGGGGINFNFNFSSVTSTEEFGEISYILEEIFTNPIVILGTILASLGAMAFGLAFSAFVGNQLRVGGCRFFLKNRKNYPTDIKTVFASYTDKTFLNIAKITIVRQIIITLGYWLFIIPGIIWTYQYFAVDYILAVRPDISRIEAFDLSKRIMNGHKMDLFVLGFSFFGWYILTAFTCGILGVFYVTPYVELTNAEFFADVRQDALRKGIITENDIPDYPEYTQAPSFSVPFGGNYTEPSFNAQPVDFNASESVNTQPVEFTEPTEYAEAEPEAPAEPIEAEFTDVADIPSSNEENISEEIDVDAQPEATGETNE